MITNSILKIPDLFIVKCRKNQMLYSPLRSSAGKYNFVSRTLDFNQSERERAKNWKMILWLDLVLEYRYKLRVKDLVVDPPSIRPLPQWWHWSLFYLSCICIWIGYFPLWLPYQCVDNFFRGTCIYLTKPSL